MAKVTLSVLDRLKDKPNGLPLAGGNEDYPRVAVTLSAGVLAGRYRRKGPNQGALLSIWVAIEIMGGIWI